MKLRFIMFIWISVSACGLSPKSEGDEKSEKTPTGEVLEGANDGANVGGGPIENGVIPDAVGSAKISKSDFLGFEPKFVFANYFPEEQFGPPKLKIIASTFIGSNVAPFRIKDWECKKCSDAIDTCFCSKASNLNSARCKAASKKMQDELADTFSNTAKEKELIITFEKPLEIISSNRDYQVTEDGWPSKDNYELTDLFAVKAASSSRELEGVEEFVKAREHNLSQAFDILYVPALLDEAGRYGHFAGSLNFAANPQEIGDKFEVTISGRFYPAELEVETADSGDTKDIKEFEATFSGQVLGEPPPMPENCIPPQNYPEPVYY